jgi:hypothetical protein
MSWSDTSPRARRAQIATFAGLSGEERLCRAVEMAEQAKEVAMAGIRARDAGLSADEVTLEWIRILHGEEVASRLV